MGLSVKGNAVTLILDCSQELTQELKRNPDSALTVNGIIMLGLQLMKDGFFTVIPVETI